MTFRTLAGLEMHTMVLAAGAYRMRQEESKCSCACARAWRMCARRREGIFCTPRSGDAHAQLQSTAWAALELAVGTAQLVKDVYVHSNSFWGRLQGWEGPGCKLGAVPRCAQLRPRPMRAMSGDVIKHQRSKPAPAMHAPQLAGRCHARPKYLENVPQHAQLPTARWRAEAAPGGRRHSTCEVT